MARNGIIEADRVINVSSMLQHGRQDPDLPMQAMKKVDRANYVLDKSKAYEDRPQCASTLHPVDRILTPRW